MSTHRNWTRLAALTLVALVVGACSRPAPRLQDDPQRTQAWSQEVVDRIAETPVQSRGRVQPLSALAGYALLHVHGRRDLQFELPGMGGPEKVTLTPVEWLLDTWCYPAQAAGYPLFRIENVGVLDALGFANEGQKQGFEWLSYAQLTEGGVLQKLRELSRKYSEQPQASRSAVEEHIVQLWDKLVSYDDLFSQLDPFRVPLEVQHEQMRQALGGERVMLGDLAEKAEAFRGVYKQVGAAAEQDEQLNSLAFYLQKVIEWGSGPSLVPPQPQQDDPDEWRQPGFAVDRVVRGATGGLVDLIVGLQEAVAGSDHASKERGLHRYAAAVAALADGREDVEPVPLEAYYHAKAFHYQSIHWFLFAFVLAAASWALPKSRLIWWAAIGVTMFALALLTYDIWLRCVITSRPPIKNLYDTFLFIGAVGVLIAVVTEFILPKRIALGAAPVFGALLVMFARLFEVADGRDTMGKVQAVLDSNFWLATHVTAINIGYGAGLIAALLANVWIYLRVFRVAHPQSTEAKALVRVVYGVTCFGLMFAVVGTILGGVWANDSWGRFWGWDPKENGALMICLAQIALLHARFIGWVRDFGFIAWSSITGMVVVFSWFHTNLLGIGLHSYGFSSGLLDAVWWLYTVQLVTVVVGTVDVMLRPAPAGAPGSAEAAQRDAGAAADAAWPTPG